MHHAFLYIPTSLHDYVVKMPYFTFCGGREPARQRLSSSFSELRYSLLEFNSRTNCQLLANWTRWNKRSKVWSSANSFFKWRFRSRRRRCCLKVMLHGTIGNDDFQRSTALQCWNNVVTIRNNIGTMLQPCVALKIVVANRPVQHHLAPHYHPQDRRGFW